VDRAHVGGPIRGRLFFAVYVVLVKIVRTGLGLRDEKGLYSFGADGDYVVLVLQDAFYCQESLAGEKQAVFVKEIGADDGVRHSGFIFQT